MARRGATEGWTLLLWSGLALVAMSLAVLAIEGTGEPGVRAWIRATARSSLLLFGLAFAASSLRRVWQSPFSAWLLRNRRQLGVSFALSHAFHLVAILWLAFGWPDHFQKGAVTIAGGGLAYVLIAAARSTTQAVAS